MVMKAYYIVLFLIILYKYNALYFRLSLSCKVHKIRLKSTLLSDHSNNIIYYIVGRIVNADYLLGT